MSFWEQYCAICRHLWVHYKWQLLVGLALSALIDILRWYHGLPYFDIFTILPMP